MRRSNSELISEILRRFLRENGLETPLNQYRLIENWSAVAGKMVADKTVNLEIRNQKLYVQLKSAILCQELMFKRKQLVDKLNSSVNAQVINEVVLFT